MSDPKRSKLKRRATLIFKTVLTVAALMLLFSTVSFGELTQAWSQAEWLGIAGALALVPVHLALRVHRWRTLLSDAGEPADAALAFRAVMVGYTFAVTTPAEIGEVVSRIRMHDSVSGSRIFGLVIVEKLFHSYLSLLPGVPALVLYVSGDSTSAILAFMGLAALAILLLLLRSRLSSIRTNKQRPQWSKVVRALHEVGNVRLTTLQTLAFSTAGILLIYALQEYFLINAITDLGFVATWNGFWAGIGLRTLAPFFIMDLGIREASHVWFFGRYGVEASAAVATSLLMFGVNVLVPACIGLVFMFRKGRAES